MGFEAKKFLKIFTAGAIAAGAPIEKKAEAFPTVASMNAPASLHKAGLVPGGAESDGEAEAAERENMRDPEIHQLRALAQQKLNDFRNAGGANLDPISKQKWESELFEMTRQYGAAMRRFRLEHGFPYPGVISDETTDRLEREATRENLTDSERQEIMERYMDELRENREMPQDTEATVRGMFCGEYPELCPPGQ